MLIVLLVASSQVVRSRMMDTRSMSSPSLVSTTQSLIQNEGWRSLYKGMHVSLVRVIPNCCLTFMSYEFFTRFARDVVMGKK